MVLELCCFEWFQNLELWEEKPGVSFRAVLFRMVPKPVQSLILTVRSFRAVLFRMVPKLLKSLYLNHERFRAVLFRMVPKRLVFRIEQK